MDDNPLDNTYRNGSTAPDPDVPAELAAFMVAVDPVLANAAELTRVVTHAHQGAATQLIDDGWAHARKWFSLSEKYAAWADYKTPARGYGIHAHAHQTAAPIRLTDDENGEEDEHECRRHERREETRFRSIERRLTDPLHLGRGSLPSHFRSIGHRQCVVTTVAAWLDGGELSRK